jgi:amino acid transporter
MRSRTAKVVRDGGIMTEPNSKPRGLTRSMRVMGVLLLTLSATTPASSVFVGVPDALTDAGTGAVLSLIAAALMAAPIAYVYAELSSAFPIAGGEYAMTGRTLGPAAGYAVLGLTAFVNMVAAAVLALGIAPYLGSLWPGLDPTAVGLAVIALTTLMGVLHIRANAWVTGVFLALELIALGVLAWLGFAHVERPVGELLQQPVMTSNGALIPASFAAIGLATSVSVYVFNGFGGAVYFAEEMHEAPRLVARTILWAVAVTVATILVPVTAVLMGAPDLRALFGADNPFGAFVQSRGGQGLAVAVNLAVALAILNAVLATILQNARFFYSTGRDRSFHPWIDQLFLATHPAFHSPWGATLAAGATAAAMCFLGMSLLLKLAGATLAITYLVLCLAVIVGRLKGSTAHALYKAPLGLVMPLLGLGGAGYVLWFAALDPDEGRVSLVSGLAVMAGSLAYYFLVVRRRGVWRVNDPEA